MKKLSASASRMADALCAVGRLFGERQWCLATSGNFSVRLDDNEILITQSGKDKATLAPGDLMICDLQGKPADAALKPSAETALHASLYRHDRHIGSVLHTHSVTSTVMSQRAGECIEITGFEMQKALPGVPSHEDTLSLQVFDNSQDMPALAAELETFLGRNSGGVPGFLIRGHGLYAWGRDIAEARRHVEGLEFLLSCLWQQALAGSR